MPAEPLYARLAVKHATHLSSLQEPVKGRSKRREKLLVKRVAQPLTTARIITGSCRVLHVSWAFSVLTGVVET
jgi:hypothetical protein